MELIAGRRMLSKIAMIVMAKTTSINVKALLLLLLCLPVFLSSCLPYKYSKNLRLKSRGNLIFFAIFYDLFSVKLFFKRRFDR
jgi:hypothetical protein